MVPGLVSPGARSKAGSAKNEFDNTLSDLVTDFIHAALLKERAAQILDGMTYKAEMRGSPEQACADARQEPEESNLKVWHYDPFNSVPPLWEEAEHPQKPSPTRSQATWVPPPAVQALHAAAQGRQVVPEQPQKIDLGALNCSYFQPPMAPPFMTEQAMDEIRGQAIEDAREDLMDPSDQAPPPDEQAGRGADCGKRSKLFAKTQPCRFYFKGWCRSGTSCSFAHGDQEMRKCPDLTKTSICHRWARHQCPRSAKECRYAHGTWDIRKSL